MCGINDCREHINRSIGKLYPLLKNGWMDCYEI